MEDQRNLCRTLCLRQHEGERDGVKQARSVRGYRGLVGCRREAHLARALLHLARQEERASSQVLPQSKGQG